MPPIIVAATLQVATAILAESALSYLGYGIQPPIASWGNMLQAHEEGQPLIWHSLRSWARVPGHAAVGPITSRSIARAPRKIVAPTR